MITTVLLILPMLVSADYDPKKIKAGIDQLDTVFQVQSWRLSEKGGAWIATTKLKDVVLSVGKKDAGLIAALTSSVEAAQAMLGCLALGNIGLNPVTEAEREKINQTIIKGTQNRGVSRMALNGVFLEVEPTEMAGAVFLSCILKPEA